MSARNTNHSKVHFAADPDDIISLVAEAQDFKVNFECEAEVNDLTSRRKGEFLDLVRKLHHYFKGQLDAALVATGIFEKATRYFIKALRKIQPPQENGTFSNLREVEDSISSWTETEDDDAEINGDVDLKSILKSFLKNITNFRILRQFVKMEIVQTLKQLPVELEAEIQTRTRGEMETLLSAWTGLLNRDNNLTKLTHPNVEAYQKYFSNEQEMECFCGILSIIPKLTDIVNRFDFLLVKYQMDVAAV
ncbi:uncharacterized protein [Amphiura filiformis]|uniref:uncharacterized protein n=1 Tax=Amphiura filiformis TaxID=82378 RepID=UPI003B2280ED